MIKKRCFIIFLTIILIVVVSAIAFWDTLLIHFAPKVILNVALSNAIVQLEQRFEGDPMIIVLNSLHAEGNQTADIELETVNSYLGNVYYDMQVQLEPHKLYGEGKVHAEQHGLDLTFYADTDFMAVSSESLVDGKYYGITYDSFQQDIRSIPLLTWMVGEPVLQSWNSKILSIQEKMEQGYSIPQLPVLSAADLQNLLLFFMKAPSDVEKTSMVVNDTVLEGHRITYSQSGPEVLKLLQQVMDVADAETANVTASFFLYKKEVVAVDLTVNTEDTTHQIRLELGTDIANDPLAAVLSRVEDGVWNQLKVRIVTSPDEDHFCEYWEINEGTEHETSFFYDWNPVTGDMLLSVNESDLIPLKLTAVENGIKIESEDFYELYRVLIQPEMESKANSIKGTAILSKGTTIETPQYKNLDQWSLDDFLMLMEGVGGLIGLTFE